MKNILILIGVALAISFTSALVSVHDHCTADPSHAKLTCMLCQGKACPRGTSSGVCNCTVFYRCPSEKCSLTVCNACYYKSILPNLNKGCPICKGHKQFKQVH